MNKAIESIIDLKVFEGNRTTIIGGLIMVMGLYQAFSLNPIPMETYAAINAILTERLAKFAKEHKS